MCKLIKIYAITHIERITIIVLEYNQEIYNGNVKGIDVRQTDKAQRHTKQTVEFLLRMLLSII